MWHPGQSCVSGIKLGCGSGLQCLPSMHKVLWPAPIIQVNENTTPSSFNEAAWDLSPLLPQDEIHYLQSLTSFLCKMGTTMIDLIQICDLKPKINNSQLNLATATAIALETEEL